jgi:hypothetical protein
VSGQIYALGAVCPGKQHLVPRRMGGAQSQSGPYEEQKNLLSLPGIERQFLSRPARSLVTIPTELSLLYVYSWKV